MAEIRVRRDGLIWLPDKMLAGLKIHPGSKIEVKVEGNSIVIRKAVGAENPFAEAAKGPDVAALDRIQDQQADAAKKARDHFEEMMKNPPEVKPEDNPDLWR